MLRTFSRRRRWWLAVVQVVLLLVTFAMPAAAASDPAPVSGTQLLQILKTYGIIKGDEQGNLNLDKPIKRAEIITIMVRAMGGEQDAALYKGWSKFNDAKGHWAEGYITYATVKGLVKGDGADTVRPDDPINYGEALTLILRLVGKEPVSGDWPLNIILSAVELGLLPSGVTAANIRETAIRGTIFQSLGTAITSLNATTGKTFLQTYVDSIPPGLELASLPSTTKEETIQISGQARDAVAVSVNGVPATLSSQFFSVDLKLSYGDRNITVEAVDLAGNRTQRQVQITRDYPLARIEVTGPDKVMINDTATFTVAGFDEKGASVPVSGLSGAVVGDIGTFTAATGLFKANRATGSGSITFRAGTVSKKIDVQVVGPSSKATGLRIVPVNNGRTVPVSKPMSIQVQVVDATNQAIADDNGREVTLMASGTGLTVTPSKTKTIDGVASFTVSGTTAGTITLSAASLNLTGSAQIATFGTATRIVLVAAAPSLVVGGTPSYTRIHAELRDDNNTLVANSSGSDITMSLSQSGAQGSLVSPAVTIRRGNSTSTATGDDGQFNVSTDTGQTVISASITSSHPYTVDPLTLSISRPSVGSGSRLQVLNVNSGLAPNAEGTVLLRVTDGVGNPITTGNYAFRIKVDTSNNETKTNGLPDGVSLKLGSTAYIPVDTGASPTGNYVIGRTINGQALLKVRYNKSGVVTLTPVQVSYTSTTYSDDGSSGPGQDSYSLTPILDRVLYTGSVAGLKIAVDSAIGNDQSAGVVSASTSNYFTVRGTVLDATGGRIPGSATPITLAPVGTATYTTPPSFPNDTVNAQDGTAEFRVYAKASVGCDTYKITAAGGISSGNLQLCVRNAVPADPKIITIRGTSGINNRVQTTDGNMEIELSWKTTGTDTWVSAIVYRGGTAFYTSSAVDMSGAAPRILVPRNVLTGGPSQYQVSLKNGAGESNRSTLSDTVTVDYESSNVSFTGAKYDSGDATATGHKLFVFGYNMATGDRIDPSKLVLKDPSTGVSLDLQGATWTIQSNSQFMVDLSTAPVKKTALESNQFSGVDVTLESLAGWYYQSNGSSAQAVTPKPVTPLGDITAISFDVVNNQLLITGQGFTTGSVDISRLRITQGANSLVLDSTNVASSTRQSDTSLVVVLTAAGANTLKDATKFNGSDVLTASLGWLTDGSYQSRAISAIPLTAKVTVTTITYIKRVGGATPAAAQLVILGSGFFSGGDVTKKGSIDLSKLFIKDLNLNQQQVLTGPGAAWDIKSDGEIRITIDGTSAQVFEDTYSGSGIYVVGQTGWFKDFQQRSAGDIPERYFRLTIN